MPKVVINGREFDSMLCKYFTVNEFFNDTINHNNLWFSNPKDFNDVYDLNLSLNLPEYGRDHFVELMLLFKERNIRFAISDEQVIDHFMNNREAVNTVLNGWYAHFVETIGVTCFSETEFNLLMWSHYANKHTGVCLKFDMHQDFEFFLTPVKVVYPEKYPVFDYLKLRRDREEIAQYMIATKSTDWAYEREVRIFKSNVNGQGRGKIQFNKGALVEVIFGCRVNDDVVTQITATIRDAGYKCRFYKMDIKRHEFGLSKSELI